MHKTVCTGRRLLLAKEHQLLYNNTTVAIVKLKPTAKCLALGPTQKVSVHVTLVPFYGPTKLSL